MARSDREHDATQSVLVPGIPAPSTVACLRSLAPRGVHTIVGSESSITPGAVSTYCDSFVELPDPTTDLSAYADRLLELAERPSVQTIIPVREEDVFVLAANRDAFAEMVATPWPTFETLRRVQDRVELFAAADDAGVDTPRTMPITEWHDWSIETIIKPRYTVSASEYLGPDADTRSIGSTIYHEPDSPPPVSSFVDRWGHVPLAQEYVPDCREYGFFALYDHGEAVATFQHCQQRGWKYCGGPSAYRESVRIPELESAGRALLDHLDWHGLAMVEFLRDPESGAFKLMEINPRFWSSLPFTVRAGVDFPYYYWQQACEGPVTVTDEYEVGLGGHLLRGEISYLHSVLTESYPLVERPSMTTAVRDVVTSLVKHPRFDYAVMDDPIPFVRDGWNTAQNFARNGSADSLDVTDEYDDESRAITRSSIPSNPSRTRYTQPAEREIVSPSTEGNHGSSK